MLEYFKVWLELKTDRRAVTALEYGLIAALMGAAILGGVGAFGLQIRNEFGYLGLLLTNHN